MMSKTRESAHAAMEVMVTVDVESWPRCSDWESDFMRGDLARDVYGRTPNGDFGIQYQVDVLAAHGLKGVFFVESLFVDALCEERGLDALKGIVKVIQDAGSEVQLHIHTEWFEKMRAPLLGSKRAYNIRELALAEQVAVLERAAQNLRAAGAANVIAYRAGNFGADWQTLVALARCGIRFDSSYNYCYLDKGCGLQTEGIMVQPEVVGGKGQEVTEYPVSCFRDFPGHYRPAQVCAVSASEMQHALQAAYEANWQSFVIVSHSFELLRDRKQARPYAQPDWSVIHRFEELCRFLKVHQKKLKTVGFAEVSANTVPKSQFESLDLALLPTLGRTASRTFSQAIRRLPSNQEETLRNALQIVGWKG